jgi:hypothetical protein
MRRIYVDFNTKGADERERVLVNTHRHPELLDVLQEGERVVRYDEEMEVEAVLEYEVHYGRTYVLGVADWPTLTYFPTDTEPSSGPTEPRDEHSTP